MSKIMSLEQLNQLEELLDIYNESSFFIQNASVEEIKKDATFPITKELASAYMRVILSLEDAITSDGYTNKLDEIAAEEIFDNPNNYFYDIDENLRLMLEAFERYPEKITPRAKEEFMQFYACLDEFYTGQAAKIYNALKKR